MQSKVIEAAETNANLVDPDCFFLLGKNCGGAETEKQGEVNNVCFHEKVGFSFIWWVESEFLYNNNEFKTFDKAKRNFFREYLFFHPEQPNPY